MIDARYSPVYILRNYVWDVIQANTDLSTADYGGLIPIVPMMEEPELTQYSKPYIVYGYLLAGTNPLPAIKQGNMTFVVFSQSFGTLTQITNIIEHSLGRMDESAKDVNRYKSQIPAYAGHDKIRFGEIHTSVVEGGSPENEDGEGDRQTAIVSVAFTYFIDHDIITTVQPTL
jgi:hypothetical protein